MTMSSRSESKSPATSLTIAIADDMPDIQALAREWLTTAGHRVFCAGNGEELLRIMEEQSVDVVITDVVMPERDGFEVIRAVKESHPHVQIITISGGATVMPANNCLRVASALGADVVLAKPFTRKQLFNALSVAAGVKPQA